MLREAPEVSLPPLVQTLWWGVDPRGFYRHCRARHGPFYVMRPVPFGAMHVTDDPEVVRAVLAADADTLRAGEANALGDALPPLLGRSSVLLLDGDEHLRQRKLMLPAFHGERMRAYDATIADATVRSLAGWPVGEPFALRPRMQDITLDIILRAVFGIRGEARLARFAAAISEAVDAGAASLLLTPPFRRLPGGFWPWPRFLRRRARLDALVFEEIAARRAAADAGDRDDVLSLLLGARFEDGAGLSDRELRDELVTLLVAGHETTATALAWTFELLFRAPAARARLETELRSGGGPYLQAVVDESLRVRPVVIDFGRTASRDVDLAGWRLPKGGIVTPSSYLVNTNPAVYDDPEAFRPERFLDARPAASSFATFGGGIRRCLGAAFAQSEMRIVLREVLRRAPSLRPASRRPERAVLRHITMAPARGVRAVLDAPPDLAPAPGGTAPPGEAPGGEA